jgi:hypothetical protein
MSAETNSEYRVSSLLSTNPLHASSSHNGPKGRVIKRLLKNSIRGGKVCAVGR